MRLLGTTGAVAVAVASALALSTPPALGQGFSARMAARLQAARAPLAQLEQTSRRRSFGATFVHVRQEVGGIPVLGAEATLSLSSAARPLLLDHTRRRIARPGTPQVSKPEAIRSARVAGRVHRLRARIRASLAILPGRSSERLVWRVLIPAARPLADLEVLVDARTRAAVRIRDLLRRASGDALVFDPNPIVEQGSRAGLADNDNADSPALNALYRAVALQDLDPAGCLSGAWVDTVIGGSGFCPAGRDFGSVTRADPCNCFDAAMAYFHIDRMQRYLQSLGFGNVVHRPIQVVLHATKDDNSFYSPSTRSLSFGDGGVNDAQDADVIAHEYGHAIQDSQAPGFGGTDESGAMGEGFGDYWQAAISANQGVSDTFNVCFAEWDTSPISNDPIPCLRRVDLQWTLSQAHGECGGNEIHCVGQAWSNMLWTIRKRLGGAATDRLIVQSQFAYTAESGFRDGALALLAADSQLYGGADRAFLTSLLVGRRFITQDQLDDEPSGAQTLAVPGQLSGRLDAGTDPQDVLAVPLAAGQGVVFRLRAGSGRFFTLALYPPSTTTIEAGSPARKTAAGNDERLAYVPGSTGVYYLAVEAEGGAGSYTVQVLLDTDADGVPNATDNCPSVANRSQADWNRNGKGDACDRSSKTTINRVAVRRHRLSVTGTLRPSLARASRWFVEVRKGRRLVARAHGVKRKGKRAGRALAIVKVPSRVHGRLRVRAVLKDPRYKRARSKTVAARVS